VNGGRRVGPDAPRWKCVTRPAFPQAIVHT
jgi:hypothetical protein